ncbi:MAG TPA: tetratricopeptide repeat protein [Thermoanaerobaculia bacterium]|nr:tetratricopeptide repeat protein [Thermoanaerobaculia bacterium]
MNPTERLPDLLEDLSLLLLTSGDSDGARRLFEGLSELAGDEPATWMIGGLVSFAEGRYGEAERLYRQVLSVRTDHTGARCFLAESLIAQRRLGEAQAILEGLAADSPEDSPEGSFARALAEGIANGLFSRGGSAPRARSFELR